jgi:hypothetical protein
MTFTEPLRAGDRRGRPWLLVALLAGAALVVTLTVALGHASWAGSPTVRVLPTHGPEGRLAGPHGVLGADDGVLPHRVTVFDDRPGVARLDPALLGALRRAATEAARHGIEVYVDSGWRSARYQERLLHEAIAKYGSAKEAARWVATPRTSAHVSGGAVDLGRDDATRWLAGHGAGYGLCQIYANEPWHYELRPEAVHEGCPRMYADAAHDPRLR